MVEMGDKQRSLLALSSQCFVQQFVIKQAHNLRICKQGLVCL